MMSIIYASWELRRGPLWENVGTRNLVDRDALHVTNVKVCIGTRIKKWYLTLHIEMFKFDAQPQNENKLCFIRFSAYYIKK